MGDFSLLETMRLDEGQVVRRPGHLARAARAAGAFGFAWDQEAVAAAVDAVAAGHRRGAWRVRLLVSPTGVPSVECTPHLHDAARVWRVALASGAIDSNDGFLRYKTTQRDVYDHARAHRPDVDDVLLWN